ncbi:MAG: hypothetical protein ACR2P0_03125 [Acidimicrobiales bacterium]
MSRLAERATEDLGEIASHASPSSTAWETIRSRFDEQADKSDVEVIMVSTQETIQKNRSARWGTLIAAAAAIVVVVGVVLAANNDDSNTASAPMSEIALTTADDYFDAYNAGDADALLGLLTEDAVIDDNFSIQPDDRAEWELLMVWFLAQGSELTTPECRVTDEVPGTSATVSCRTTEINAVIRASQSPPVKAIITLDVTPAGITRRDITYGADDFGELDVRFDQLQAAGTADDPVVDFRHSSARFENWLTLERPEAVDARFGFAANREEAERTGIARAALAQEWADFLEANGCTYLDNC